MAPLAMTPIGIYMMGWATACLVALHLMVRHRGNMGLVQPTYWRYLFRDWKIATFLVATAGLTVLAPYSGDPTWDYFDAVLISTLTFATAPWAIGIVYRGVRGKATLVQVYVAVCTWFFSACWSYDLYILMRDGAYPAMWYSNLYVSSGLYILAGLLWNLEWKPGRGVIFGFMAPDWPQSTGIPAFRRIFWFALPFMILAAATVAMFFV